MTNVEKIIKILSYSCFDDLWGDVNFDDVEELMSRLSSVEWKEFKDKLPLNTLESNLCLIDVLSADGTPSKRSALLKILLNANKSDFLAYIPITNTDIFTDEEKIAITLKGKTFNEDFHL